MASTSSAKKYVLNVAENYSTAKEITKILSDGKFREKEDADSPANRIFKFKCEINTEICKMYFMSIRGPTIKIPEFSDADAESCEPKILFKAPLKKIIPKDKHDVVDTLKKKARKCEILISWMHLDEQGERAASDVAEICREANRSLVVHTAIFFSLTDKEVRKTLQQLKPQVPLKQSLVDAMDTSEELELRCGDAFTQFLTKLARDKCDYKGGIVNDPFQFPILGFIVKRYWEHLEHQEERFWSIKCFHNSVEFIWKRGQLFNYAFAHILFTMCQKECSGTVTDVQNGIKRTNPPLPLNKFELLKRASLYFGLSAERTKKVAEELFQSGFISCPHTETDCFSVETDFRVMLEQLKRHAKCGSYVDELLDDQSCSAFRIPVKGKHDDTVYPPIHPTKFSDGQPEWSRDHAVVYELVLRHFLACVSQPCIESVTTVEIKISGESFVASEGVIIHEGFLSVYTYDEAKKGSSKDTLLQKVTRLQKYKKEEKIQIKPTELELFDGLTSAPDCASEADVLTWMDKEKISTGATMNDRIEKLIEQSYVDVDQSYATMSGQPRKFIPTRIGASIIHGFDDIGSFSWSPEEDDSKSINCCLSKPEFQAEIEGWLKKVSSGEKDKSAVLKMCLDMMQAMYENAKSNEDKLCKAMDMFFERSNSSRTYSVLEVKKDETILTYQSGKPRKRQTSDGEKDHSDLGGQEETT